MSEDSAPGTGEPILIVDDEKNIRRTLGMVLESEGHAVHEAGSIAEAEAVLARENVDVMLLDGELRRAQRLRRRVLQHEHHLEER